MRTTRTEPLLTRVYTVLVELVFKNYEDTEDIILIRKALQSSYYLTMVKVLLPPILFIPAPNTRRGIVP